LEDNDSDKGMDENNINRKRRNLKNNMGGDHPMAQSLA
jgi:hypothetical protein